MLNRIMSAEEGPVGNQSVGRWGQTYTIDAWGNLTHMTTTKGTINSFSASVGTNNRLNSAGFAHDAAGNMTQNGSATYSYDGESRITTTAGYTYTYDADGKRIKKTDGTTTTYYYYGGSADVFTEFIGTAQTDYIFAGSKRVAKAPSEAITSNTEYYHGDHLGSARLMTDASGNPVANSEATMLPYGQQYEPAAGTNHYKFTGKERDGESGFDLLKRRYLGAIMGRFSSTDPLGILKQKMVDPQQWNMYSYARNNPLRFVDPSGEKIELTGDAKARQRLLKALRQSVGEKVGDAFLFEEKDKKTGRYYVRIHDGGKSFNSVNAVANKLAGIINDSRTATIQFVNPGSELGGGTMGSLNDRERPAFTRYNGPDATIYVTSGEIGDLPATLLSSGIAQKVGLAEVLIHEIGHVDYSWFHKGWFGGRRGSNGDAVRIENQFRQQEGLPLRLGHDKAGDVDLEGIPY